MEMPPDISTALPDAVWTGITRATEQSLQHDPHCRVTSVFSLPMWRLYCEVTGAPLDTTDMANSVVEIEDSTEYYIYSTASYRPL